MFGKKKPKAVAKAPGQLGIHITADGIALAHVIDDENGKPKLMRAEFMFASEPTEQEEILKNLGKDESLKDVATNVVLSSSKYQLLLIEKPDVELPEIQAALRWSLQELVPFPLEEGLIDYFEVPVPRASDNSNLVYATVARKTVINELVRQMQVSELNLQRITIPEIALKNLYLLSQISDKPTVLFRIRATGGRLIYLKSNELYMSRNIDLRLEGILDSEISSDESQRVLDELALEIQRSMDYCASYLRLDPADKILFMPFAAENNDLIEKLGQALNITTEVLNFNEVLDCEMEMDNTLSSNCLLAIGAALHKGLKQ